MNTFAIETATAHGSIALCVGNMPIESVCIGERFEHSTTLLPKMHELLESHNIRPRDLDLVCVSKGPGSFTGLRVGIACAKGLALGLGIPLIGISTFEVLLTGFLRDTHSPHTFPPLAIA